MRRRAFLSALGFSAVPASAAVALAARDTKRRGAIYRVHPQCPDCFAMFEQPYREQGEARDAFVKRLHTRTDTTCAYCQWRGMVRFVEVV